MAKSRAVSLRLWVSNQGAVGADSDYTSAHLNAAGWTGGEDVLVEATAEALDAWYRDVFLPLRQRVAESGWGDSAIDAATSVRPVLAVSHDVHWTESSRGLMIDASSRGDESWVAEAVSSLACDDDHSFLNGYTFQQDLSGIGAAWRTIDVDGIPASIVEEIAAEIESGNDDADDYVGGNGQHYRWFVADTATDDEEVSDELRDEISAAIDAADLVAPEQVADLCYDAAASGCDWKPVLARCVANDSVERRRFGIDARKSTIRIFRDGVLAGTGTIDSDNEIVCDAVLGADQDASDETYEMIQDAIDREPQDADRYTGEGSVERPDGVYSWIIG
jgi:hypothetical protein